MIINNEDPDTAPSEASDVGHNAIFTIGEWSLNTNTNQLLRGDSFVEIEHRLTNLLVFLLRNRDRVLTKDEILKAVWPKKVVNDDSVAVAISQLRKALDDNPRAPQYIKTIPGVGYQFIFQEILNTQTLISPVVANDSSRIKKYWLVLIFALLACALAVFVNYSVIRTSMIKSDASVLPILSAQDAKLLTQAMQLSAGWNNDELRLAVKLYKQLVGKTSNNAQVYLGIAEAKIKLLNDKMGDAENYQELSLLLNKALELDPKLARAHLWLAELILIHDVDPVEAEKHYKISAALAPSDDLIHYRYAHFLFIYKRFSEAREQINISRTLNPLSFSATSMVWVYLLQGNNELAARELNRIESTEDGDSFFKVAAQNVYYQMGDEQKTYDNMQWFFKKAQFSDEKISNLNQLFARGGLKAVYQWLLDHKETADVGQYTPPISWARYAVAVGDNKSAINYLEQAFAKRQPHVECAVADPRYAPLKDEVKFKEFIARFGSSVAH